MKMRLLKHLVYGLLFVGLSGCTGEHSDFACNAITPDHCLSLDATNHLANQGAFGGEVHQQKHHKKLPEPNTRYKQTSREKGFVPQAMTDAELIWIAPETLRQKQKHAEVIVLSGTHQGDVKSASLGTVYLNKQQG